MKSATMLRSILKSTLRHSTSRQTESHIWQNSTVAAVARGGGGGGFEGNGVGGVTGVEA